MTMGGFKKFLLRDNLVDLAVAFVIGAAFAALVTGLVKDLITPSTGRAVHGRLRRRHGPEPIDTEACSAATADSAPPPNRKSRAVAL